MKCIIAGPRTMTGRGGAEAVWQAVRASGWKDLITEVVSGGATGIDTWGEKFADAFELEMHRIPAKWKTGGHGRAEGFLRNSRMAQYAKSTSDNPALIAIVTNPPTKGTTNMIQVATELGLQVYTHHV